NAYIPSEYRIATGSRADDVADVDSEAGEGDYECHSITKCRDDLDCNILPPSAGDAEYAPAVKLRTDISNEPCQYASCETCRELFSKHSRLRQERRAD